MEILIVGAGISGLALALQLHRPQVVERAPALRGGSYMIDYFGPGYAVAERR